MKVPNSCSIEKEHCINCHDHFLRLRPSIKEAVVSEHFKKDVEDYEEIVSDILDCDHIGFHELHKFEEEVEGVFVFRAKKEKSHYVYCINGDKIIFLRGFNNFKDYKKFLIDKKRIKKIIS